MPSTRTTIPGSLLQPYCPSERSHPCNWSLVLSIERDKGRAGGHKARAGGKGGGGDPLQNGRRAVPKSSQATDPAGQHKPPTPVAPLCSFHSLDPVLYQPVPSSTYQIAQPGRQMLPTQLALLEEGHRCSTPGFPPLQTNCSLGVPCFGTGGGGGGFS